MAGKRYAPGGTVTYRLSKHDQDIADYLNLVQEQGGNGSIAECHRKALRAMMSGTAAAEPVISAERATPATDQDMLLMLQQMNEKIQLVLDLLKQGATPELGVTHESSMESERDETKMDQEELRNLADDLMEF